MYKNKYSAFSTMSLYIVSLQRCQQCTSVFISLSCIGMQKSLVDMYDSDCASYLKKETQYHYQTSLMIPLPILHIFQQALHIIITPQLCKLFLYEVITLQNNKFKATFSITYSLLYTKLSIHNFKS